MEHSFFHPARGYWQTISAPNAEVLAGYPEGTIQVPLKPGSDYEWRDGAWEHVPPDPAEALAAERAGMRLTFSQLMIGLVSEGWITEAEGDAWLDGTVPAPVLALIATLPEAEQFPARARAKRLIEAQRLDPLVIGLAQAEGKTDAELDAFFQAYAQV